MSGGRLHPSSFLFSAARLVRAFIIPAGVAGVGGGGGDPASVLRIVVAILAIPSLIWGFLDYLLFRYRLHDDALVVDSGVLNRQRRVVRPARIQNVELRQGALQRLLGVAEVRVETAGAGETEVVLSVLRLADADALRTRLLERRAALRPAAQYGPEAQVLARIGPRELLVAGATANEAGLIAAALAGLLQFREVPVLTALLQRVADGTLQRFVSLGPAGTVVIAIALVITAGWLISIVGALVGYHGFTLERAGADLRIRRGLLARSASTIPLARVQAVRIEQSLLRRPLGLAVLTVSTAGSPGRESRGSAVLLPIGRVDQVPAFLAPILPDLHLENVQLARSHPRARRKLLVRGLLLFALIGGTAALRTGSAWPLAVGAPLALLVANAAYRARGYARAGGYVITRAGVWNRITWIVPVGRVQAVHVTQSPIQRLQRLASVAVDTAGGGRTQPVALDLGAEDARTWGEASLAVG